VFAVAVSVRAEILVTKSGSKYEGTVTLEGDRYILVKPGGGRMTFPMRMVKEVVSAGVFRERFLKRVGTADLTDEDQVEELIEYALKNELVKEARKLAADAHKARLAQAGTRVQALKNLAAWSRRHSLAREAAACEALASKQVFAPMRRQAGKAPMALAKLARWCWQHGLPAEAREMEAKALRLAPSDSGVQRELRRGLERQLLASTTESLWKKHMKLSLAVSPSEAGGVDSEAIGFRLENKTPCTLIVFAGSKRLSENGEGKPQLAAGPREWRVHPDGQLSLFALPGSAVTRLPMRKGRFRGVATVLKASLCAIRVLPTRAKLPAIEMEIRVEVMAAAGRVIVMDYEIHFSKTQP
jgi:hypothetical protein